MLDSKLALRLQTTYTQVKRPLYAVLTLLGTGALLWFLRVDRAGLIASSVLVGVMIVGIIAAVLVTQSKPELRRMIVPITIAGLVVCLALSKYFGTHRIVVLGISYLAFRLIHLMVELPRLPELQADDIITYALFPMAFVAGPIHRINTFLPQIDNPRRPKSEADLVAHLTRIGYGLFKKLALANALNLVALNDLIVSNPAISRVELFVSLLAYAFMIYFDFSGYTDIALGLAGLIGFTLPENFQNPYAASSIARFWQTWHMSLSFWLRDYLFFPISRSLLRRLGSRFSVVIMIFANTVTMFLAGLWHGISIGFVLWGIWHGLGLAFYALWSAFLRRRGWRLPAWVGVALTFTFVLIGWSFFALSGPSIVLFWKKLTGL